MLSRPLKWSEFMAAIVTMGIFLGILIFPVYASNGHSHRTACLSNMKQIAVGAVMYASDFDDRLPHHEWVGQLGPYTKNASLFTCPQLKSGKGSGYAMNGRVRGKSTLAEENPAELAMLFETNDLTLGAIGWSLQPLDPGRHENMVGVAFLDGHVKGIRNDALDKVRLTILRPAKK